jgi:hypothetical protein
VLSARRDVAIEPARQTGKCIRQWCVREDELSTHPRDAAVDVDVLCDPIHADRCESADVASGQRHEWLSRIDALQCDATFGNRNRGLR